MQYPFTIRMVRIHEDQVIFIADERYSYNLWRWYAYFSEYYLN